jgi:hypothetical protein
LRQVRLVTLAFEPLPAPDQRKLARTAALDLVKGDQGISVFYSVVVIDTPDGDWPEWAQRDARYLRTGIL